MNSDKNILISAITTNKRHSKIDPKLLVQRWGIGLDSARKTLKTTIQIGLRYALHPLTRRYDTELILRIASRDGRPPLGKLTGDTIDLSEYLDFDFYDPVWYWETLSGEKGEALPGRWLGIPHYIGAGMCYSVLNKNENVISRSTVQHITKKDLQDPKMKETLENFDNTIKMKVTNYYHVQKIFFS